MPRAPAVGVVGPSLRRDGLAQRCRVRVRSFRLRCASALRRLVRRRIALMHMLIYPPRCRLRPTTPRRGARPCRASVRPICGGTAWLVGNLVVRTCDKAFHADQAAARLALASIHEKATTKGKPARLPVRVYPCDVCDGWHLTAKPVKGRKPPWDRDPAWVRPNGKAHLQPRSAEQVSGSRRQRKRARAAARR